MNWLDLVLIGYIAVRTFGGYHVGFIKSFFNMTGFIIAILAARLYHGAVSSMIVGTSLGEKISTSIYEKVHSAVDSNLAASQHPSLSMGETLDLFNMPDFLKKSIIEGGNNTAAVTLGKDNMIEYISSSLSSIAITMISVIIIFIVVRILVSILANMLNDIARLPILKQLNKVGGLALGFVISILTIMIVFAIMTPFLNFGSDTGIAAAINNSSIAKVIYYNNFILNWLLRAVFKAFA